MAYNPEAVRELFDQIAEQEDALEKRHFLRNEIPREFIKRYLKPSDHVLDAGGGTGVNAILMATLCQKVTLLDISPRILEFAARNIQDAGLAGKIDLVQGDIVHLGQFDNDTFSFIVCVGSVISHTLGKNRQAVQEIVRLARPGSILVLGCDSIYGMLRHVLRYDDSLLDEAEEIFEHQEFLNNGQVEMHLYTVAEMAGLLTACGLEILEWASTPVIINSRDEGKYSAEEQWQRLKALEFKACQKPELLGIGTQLLCVARKL
jgi:ubiquinone/menaquinone biosynthesis C-methylase UbiE